MLFFQPAPPTRYDLNFTLAGFPVRVHPSFWLVAILFSLSSRNLLFILIWIAAIFVSILVHELGHALAFRRFGQPSSILLHFSGGLTIPESLRWGGGYASVSLTSNQQILISLAGPGAGFLFAGVVIASVLAVGGSVSTFPLLGFIPIPTATLPFGGSILNTIVSILLWVNVFWGLVNLVPVFPLDGGNVSRHILLQVDPWDGVRKSLWISVVVGTLMALLGLVYFNSLFMTILFGLLAFQSYQSLQGRGWGF